VEFFLLHHDFDLARDLAYGSDAREQLDVYRPRTAKAAAPVVIFLYGSRWQYGSRNEYHLLGQALTGRGLVAVVPDYRLYPQVTFPGWVEDAARAVRWASDSIGSYGGDPKRIFIVGHSAGAHTAALLALDPHYLRRAGVPPGTVRGVVSLAGPVATAWTDSDIKALMGPPESWRASYPLEHADGTGPPLLLLHGALDETVAAQNSVQLGSRIRELGGCARVVIYRGLTHVGIVIALAVPSLNIAPVLEEIVRFVRSPEHSCEPHSQPH
jgi:acetyl esterase/lipase